jgi:hypothetical protein
MEGTDGRLCKVRGTYCRYLPCCTVINSWGGQAGRVR